MAATPDLTFEQNLLADGFDAVVCVDEVGRGAVCGPCSCGAVVVTADTGPPPDGLRDSKLLGPQRRRSLVAPVRAWAAGAAVGHAAAHVVDRDGILAALAAAASTAIGQLTVPARAVILLDGNFDWLAGHVPWPVVVRTKADRDCAGVAGASVLAKVERDDLLDQLDRRHPGYGLASNKGYLTVAHRDAIVRLGPCDEHRRSWNLT